MRKRSEQKKLCIRICLTVVAVVTALIFLMPIVLTIANSFMSAAEITSNYGSIFQRTDTGGRQYISQTVNLKFIPDMVTFSQYATVLFKSPDYLLKFWNSLIFSSSDRSVPADCGGSGSIWLHKDEGKAFSDRLFCLCDPDDDAVSGNAGAKLSGIELDEAAQHELEHLAPGYFFPRSVSI